MANFGKREKEKGRFSSTQHVHVSWEMVFFDYFFNPGMIYGRLGGVEGGWNKKKNKIK